MARRTSFSLLLALSLLFGLWISAAHDLDHHTAGHGEHCAVCVVAHTLGNGMSASAIGVVLAAHPAERPDQQPALPPRRACVATQARGPPGFLA